jgi:hypothetical protein
MVHKVLLLWSVVLLGGLGLIACGGSPAGTSAGPAPTQVADAGADETAPAEIPADGGDAAGATAPTGGGGGVGDGSSAPIEARDVGKVPSGWKLVQDAEKLCRIAVPPDYITGVLEGAAQSPTGGVTALISSDRYANFGGNWKSYKQKVNETYADYSVVEDSDTVYYLRGPGGERLRVSDQGDHECGVLVTPASVQRAEQSRSEIAQILESIGPAE